MRRAVVSGLQAHRLSGLEAGHSQEDMTDRSREGSRAQQKQNQLWSFPKSELEMQENWELHPPSLRSDEEACGHVRGDTSAPGPHPSPSTQRGFWNGVFASPQAWQVEIPTPVSRC